MRTKTIIQHDQRDCGAACLATLARYYHCKMTVSTARMMCKTDQIGTNLYGLVSAAGMLGFEARSLKGTRQELLQSIQNGEIRFPFIAHIINESNMPHFIVVFNIKKDKFICGDPETGNCKLSTEAFFYRWTGYIVCLSPSEKGIKKPQEKQSAIGKGILKGSIHRLVIVAVLSLIVAGIGILSSFVFEIMIDGDKAGSDTASSSTHVFENNTNNEEQDLGTDIGAFFLNIEDRMTFSSFNTLFLSILILYVIQTMIQIVRGKLILTVSKSVDIRLIFRYVCHVQDVNMEYLHTLKAGEYLSRMSDADVVRNAISSLSVSALLDFVMLFGCGVILFSMERTLFFISLLVLFLYAVLVLIMKKPIEKSNRRIMQNNAEVQSYFKETIDGAELIRAGAVSGEIKEKATKLYMKFADSVVKNGMLGVSMSSFSEMLEAIGSVIVLWLGYSLINSNALSLGSLVTFFVLLSYFTTPAKNLINLQPEIQTAKIAAERLRDVLDMPALKEPENADPIPDTIDNWSAEHITFRYGNREAVLDDVSVRFHKGERIAIVGESGCGKSTLAKLFLGLYSPEKGSVKINGQDISAYNTSELCQSAAYVSQDTFLFSDTIKNNLTLGLHDIKDAEIQEVCKACQLDSLINSLPLGINTPIEENGINLSGGQRQRISLARALLRKPKLLIIDEATSNLDTITENKIFEMLQTLSDELTCVIIAHRLSVVRDCDRIYVMEGGKITEQGNHEELLDHDGKYSMLCRQFA